MKKKLSFKEYLSMFLTFLKLGSLSFGGGNTMVSMLEGELIEKKKWITLEELTEMIAVAECTPGPIAINIATYIGYRKGGIFGALMTTLGIVIPPVICMFILATFLNFFESLSLINYMLTGLKCAVLVLLTMVSVNLIKRTKIDLVSIILIVITIGVEIVVSLLNISLSAIYLIILGGATGLIVYGIIPKKRKEKK